MKWGLALTSVLFACFTVTATAGSGADFPISQEGSLQLAPAIAHDSRHNRFFAVWSDFRNKRNTGLDVYGQLLDSKGQPASEEIPVTTASKGQGFASVSFDPAVGRYLVVWTDWRNSSAVDSDIYGRFFNADGTPHGEGFAVAKERGASQKFPAIAFDPHHKRFLVVWSDARRNRVEEIHGRFVDPEGTLAGEEFRVTGEGGWLDRTSLTFDERRKRFLVVWRESEGQTGKAVANVSPSKAIYGAFVDAEQAAAGSRFLIAEEKQGSLPPSLYAAGYSLKDDLFFVAWTSGRNYDARKLDVYGVFLRPEDGSFDRPVFPIAAEIESQEAASVAYDKNRNRFLVVWYDLRRDRTAKNMDIYGKYIYPNAPMSEEFLISDLEVPGMRRNPVLSFNPKNDDFLILWEDGRDGGMAGRQIYGNLM